MQQQDNTATIETGDNATTIAGAVNCPNNAAERPVICFSSDVRTRGSHPVPAYRRLRRPGRAQRL